MSLKSHIPTTFRTGSSIYGQPFLPTGTPPARRARAAAGTGEHR